MDHELLDELRINRERIEDRGVVRFTSETRWGEMAVRIEDIEAQGWETIMEQVVGFFLGQDVK